VISVRNTRSRKSTKLDVECLGRAGAWEWCLAVYVDALLWNLFLSVYLLGPCQRAGPHFLCLLTKECKAKKQRRIQPVDATPNVSASFSAGFINCNCRRAAVQALGESCSSLLAQLTVMGKPLGKVLKQQPIGVLIASLSAKGFEDRRNTPGNQWQS